MPARQGDCEEKNPHYGFLNSQPSGASHHLPSQGGFIATPTDAPENATLYSLLRLRIPSQYYSKEKHFLPVLEGAAIIREIHTYGEQVEIG